MSLFRSHHFRRILICSMIFCACGINHAANVFWPTPGLDVATQQAAVLECVRNLQKISLAARLWSAEHNGEIPGSFLEFTNHLSSPALLYCPANFREPPLTNWNELSWEDIDYIWTGANSASADVVCVCRIHTSTAKYDGSVVAGHERPGWPYFTAGAIMQHATPGSSALFGVALAPDVTLPLRFQWRREDLSYQTNTAFVTDPESPGGGFWQTNRIPIFSVTRLQNQTNATLLLHNVQTNDSAYYSLVVSNALGASLSHRTRLIVTPEVATMTNESWSETICLNNLKQIALLANLWANDHTDRKPRNFAEMTNRFGSSIFGWPLVLFCRSDAARPPPPNWIDFDFQNTSYELVSADDPNPHTVFCRCRIHGFYAEMNGRAVSRPEFQATILTNTSVELVLEIFAGRTNILERSTNLTTWSAIQTFSNTNGLVPFLAPAAGPHLFFRLRLSEDE